MKNFMSLLGAFALVAVFATGANAAIVNWTAQMSTSGDMVNSLGDAMIGKTGVVLIDDNQNGQFGNIETAGLSIGEAGDDLIVFEILEVGFFTKDVGFFGDLPFGNREGGTDLLFVFYDEDFGTFNPAILPGPGTDFGTYTGIEIPNLPQDGGLIGPLEFTGKQTDSETVAIPTPTSAALALVGGLVLGLRRLRRRA